MDTMKRYGMTLVLVGVIAGCGDDPKPAPKLAPPIAAITTNVPNAPAGGAAATPAVDPMTPRYEATMADGIDFRKPGYPTFLTEVSGIGAREDWGRWTEGSVAKLRFKDPLPPKFTIIINAGALGPNFAKPVVVRAGNVQKEFSVNGPISSTPPGVQEFTLAFDGVTGADSIEIVPPKPVRPKDMDSKSDDQRLLGVGLVSLKIQK